MKILHITCIDLTGSSSSAVRSRQLVQGLIDLGHAVRTVHAGQVTGVRLTCPLHRRQTDCAYCRCPVGRLYRYLLYRALRLDARLRPAAINRRMAALLQSRIAAEASFDVVITSSDPASSHQLVRDARRRGLLHRCVWIQHWGDPLVSDISRNWLAPRSIVRGVESRLLSSADRIVYVSPFTLEQQRRLYPAAAQRMHWLPVPSIGEVPEVRPTVDDVPLEVGYFGDYRTINRNVAPLFEAVVRAADVRLHIAGEGDAVIPVCDRIISHPRLPMSELQPLLATCHVVVCVLNRSGTQIPGKVYHWAGSRRHILVTYEVNQMPVVQHLQRYERFVFCANEPEAILAALQDIREGKYDHLAQPCELLSPQVIAKQFLEIAG